jgi:outer membrane protein assembly factor BamB
MGKGWSSPALWGNMVVVTAETDASKRAVIALSAADGKELWRHEEAFVPHNIHKTYNTFASSSAFIDAERIYINWSTNFLCTFKCFSTLY